MISSDVEEAPTDIRHFEFIHYQLDKHVEFLTRLDNAIANVFLERYDGLISKGYGHIATVQGGNSSRS